MNPSDTANHVLASSCESKNDSLIDIKFNSYVDLVKIDIGVLDKKLAGVVVLL